MEKTYDMIFKRKSMRKFDEKLCLSPEELNLIEEETKRLTPLDGGIRVSFRIVKREATTAKFGEYCLLAYSEKKPKYLLNAGYLLEQLDLFFTANDIGACWYGIAKPDMDRADGLDYVIMLAFGKSRPQDFRKDLSEFNRKDQAEIWHGNFDPDVIEAVRLSPSACNTQTWRFESKANRIAVFRDTDVKSFIIPDKLSYFNTIDLGICLCIFETAMQKKGYTFERTIADEEKTDGNRIKIAEYEIK